MDNFATALANQNNRIADLEGGLAAVAAIPDQYLDRDESYPVSGGFSVIGGKVGFGGGIALRGNERWSFGASGGYSDGQAVGKVQFRFAN